MPRNRILRRQSLRRLRQKRRKRLRRQQLPKRQRKSWLHSRRRKRRISPLPIAVITVPAVILPRATAAVPTAARIIVPATPLPATTVHPAAMTAAAQLHRPAADSPGRVRDSIPFPVHSATAGVQHMALLILPAAMPVRQSWQRRAAQSFVS